MQFHSYSVTTKAWGESRGERPPKVAIQPVFVAEGPCSNHQQGIQAYIDLPQNHSSIDMLSFLIEMSTYWVNL